MNQEQEVTINVLPDEIFLKVFDYLDFQSLMNSFLVCRKWNETMGKSFTIMKRMKLDFRRQSMHKFDRSYQTIKISGVDENWNTILEAMSRCSHLRVLEIDDCRMGSRDVQVFNETLKSLTKLQTLSIKGLTFEKNVDVDLSHLHRLKSLVLMCNDCEILKFPETAQLTSLKVRYSQSSEVLIDFLSRQKSLEELAINDSNAIIHQNAFETMHEIQFPLKKLALHNCANFFGSEENLLVFMNKFVNSLEELEIGKNFPTILYLMIFKNFHKLHTLHIDMEAAPSNPWFYENLTPNLAVRKLIVNDTEDNLETNKLTQIMGFILAFRNVQTLVFLNSGLRLRVILFVFGLLTSLENFQIYRNFSVPPVCRFPKLKTLTIMNIFEETEIEEFWGTHINALPKIGYWEKIIRTFPNIEVLKVASCERRELLDATNIEIIARGWPQLKYVKLGSGFKASIETLEPFLRNCQHLKTVEISWISSEEKEVLCNFLGNRISLIIHAKESDKRKMFDECYLGMWKDYPY